MSGKIGAHFSNVWKTPESFLHRTTIAGGGRARGNSKVLRPLRPDH